MRAETLSPTPKSSVANPTHAPRHTDVDLFALGRQACAIRDGLNHGQGLFSRTRQLNKSGAWIGPRDAADGWINGDDVQGLGGLARILEQGVRVVLTDDAALAQAATALDLRVWWRLPYHRDDARLLRETRIQKAIGQPNVEAILPTPEGEPMGIDTLSLFAQIRITVSTPHLIADFSRLGHRLAQMSLTMGADQLFGPVVAERALRLGDNANNPAMTRREAAALLRGAGLVPHERTTLAIVEFEP
ncbi:MAG: hypothetical protein SGI86_16275 [Deltaproteobacteria bacterium]|nr:hypothetical protein [Deltaproteobacteria bacterium]